LTVGLFAHILPGRQCKKAYNSIENLVHNKAYISFCILTFYVTGSNSKMLSGDSFPKIIVRYDIRKRWYDDYGVLNIGILDFLLDDGIV